MNEIYVVTTLTEEGYEYLKYEGDCKHTAIKIYEEFKERRNNFKVSFYKKTIIEEVDKRKMQRCDNCGELVSKEYKLAYCIECGASVCACCIGDNYDDICRDCES